jgi:GntR family transcriptional regulator
LIIDPLTGTEPLSGQKGVRLRRIVEELMVDLGPGGRLPSERALAERYGVARMTVRAELDRLVQAGAVERAHGRGTFVAGAKLLKTQRLLSFSDEMRQRGMKPGAIDLGREIQPADEEVASALEVEPGAPVVVIERIRTADGRRMALEWAHLDASRFGDLAGADFDDRSLYEELASRWGVRPTHAVQRVGAVALNTSDASWLRVRPRSPALRFTRTARDEWGRVIEHTVSLYRADRYEVVFAVTADHPGTARTTLASPHPRATPTPSDLSAAPR